LRGKLRNREGAALLLLFGLWGCGDSLSGTPGKEVAGDESAQDAEVAIVGEVVFADTGSRDACDAVEVAFRGGESREEAWTPTPCTNNTDCESGYCLQVDALTGESVCTQPCVEDCPGDWECKLVYFDPPDLSSLCVPPGSCVPSSVEGDFSLDGKDDDCDGVTDEDALVSLSVAGRVWANGWVSGQGGGYSVDGALGSVTFEGETSDGVFVIRSGLRRAWKMEK